MTFYDIYARNAIKKQVFKNINSTCGNYKAHIWNFSVAYVLMVYFEMPPFIQTTISQIESKLFRANSAGVRYPNAECGRF